MRVLVTGARGKVGRAVCRRLMEAGLRGTRNRSRRSHLGPGGSRRARGLLAGRPHRRRLCLCARSRLRHRRAHGGDPAADPQPAARRLRQQHREHVQHARSGDRGRRAPVRELLERDCSGIHLRPATLRAGLPPDRRRARRSAPGSVRDREVVRRAPVRPGDRALRPPVHVDSPVLGSGRGELRAEPRPDRPRSVRPGRELLLVRRRATTSATLSSSPSRPTCPGTRSSTSPRPTRSAAIRSSETVTTLLRRRRDRVPPARARGRLGDLERQGSSACSAGARRGRWRDYLDDEGRRADVRTRRLGSDGPGAHDRRIRRLGDRRAVAVRLGRSRRRRLGRRDPARASSSASTGSTPPPSTGSAIPRRSSDARSSRTASARTSWSSRSAGGVGRAAEGVIENDLRPESIREECEQSLRRLGVERIDLYQFHWPDRTTGTALEDSWGDHGRARRGGQGRVGSAWRTSTSSSSSAARPSATSIRCSPRSHSSREALA